LVKIKMSDIFSKEKRSQTMSQIKNKETKLELKFKNMLQGLRFRYQPKLIGKPDFALKNLKIAIFVDSCFWHKCPRHFRQPKSNKTYWIPKIDRNVKRSKEINCQLKKEGWKILRFWEHETIKNPEKCMRKIIVDQ